MVNEIVYKKKLGHTENTLCSLFWQGNLCNPIQIYCCGVCSFCHILAPISGIYYDCKGIPQCVLSKRQNIAPFF